jgi:hypothetical protein
LFTRTGYPILDLFFFLSLDYFVQHDLQPYIHFLRFFAIAHLDTDLPHFEPLLDQTEHRHAMLVVDVVLEGIEGSGETAVLKQEIILTLVTVDEENILEREAVFRLYISIWMFESY